MTTAVTYKSTGLSFHYAPYFYIFTHILNNNCRGKAHVNCLFAGGHSGVTVVSSYSAYGIKKSLLEALGSSEISTRLIYILL